MGIARQLYKNILSSWLAYAVRLALGFVFVPYITSVFGSERYGVWVIIFQAISYVSLFDLGFERAVIRYVARYRAQGDENALRQTLATSQAMFVLLSPVVAISVGLFAAVLFDWIKVADPGLREEGQIALTIIGLLLALRFASWAYANALVGLQRLDVMNGISILEESIRIGLLSLLLSQGYGMIALAVATLGVSFIRILLSFLALRYLEPGVRWKLRQFDGERFRELFRYSRASFGIAVAWLVIFNSDTILLGMLASGAAAGIYAPAAQLMLYLRHIVNAIGTPLTPAISHLEAQGRDQSVIRTYLTGLKYVSFISVVLSTGVILFAKPFVALWLPPEFVLTGEVMIILAVGSAIFLPQIIGNSILFGIERHRYLFLVLVCEAGLKILLSLWLAGPYGARGMAVAAAAPQVVLYLTLYPFLMSKVLAFPLERVLAVQARSGLLALIVTTAAGLPLRFFITPDNWGMLAVEALITGGVALAAGWYLVLEASDRARLTTAILSRLELRR